MDARWMPMLAAGLGVLGGIGGTLVGGYVANQGQEKRLDQERAAAIADLRIAAYGDYLGAAQEVVATALARRSQADVNAAYIRLSIAEARVVLVAQDDKVSEAAETLRLAVTADDQLSPEEQATIDAYNEAADQFLDVARLEVGETRE